LEEDGTDKLDVTQLQYSERNTSLVAVVV